MSYGVTHILIIVTVLNILVTQVNVQFAMPLYVPGAVPHPMYAVPAPMPIAVAIEWPKRKTTTTTTTTTPEPHRYAIAMPVPVPMPMPVQLAVPAQPPPVFCQGKPKPKSCPPCPPCICLPSCTPAFFSYCSPCHQKCRCHNPEDAPVPLPPGLPVPVPAPMYPIPVPAAVGPPPVMVVPLPPIIRTPVVSSDSGDTSDSCDSDSHHFRKRKIKTIKRRMRKYRRNAGVESEGDADLVKPVLSYISEDGDVKFETKLSNKDALKILNEGMIKPSKEKEIMDIDDSVIVKNARRKSGRRYNKVLLKESPTNHELRRGKNKHIFQPPSNRNIDQVEVSFKVS